MRQAAAQRCLHGRLKRGSEPASEAGFQLEVEGFSVFYYSLKATKQSVRRVLYPFCLFHAGVACSELSIKCFGERNMFPTFFSVKASQEENSVIPLAARVASIPTSKQHRDNQEVVADMLYPDVQMAAVMIHVETNKTEGSCTWITAPNRFQLVPDFCCLSHNKSAPKLFQSCSI